MAIKKSELYSSLWAGADSLRGGMDASEYKNYVLNLLFLKYISDKARNNTYSEIEVPEGCFYEDILALEGDKEIGDKLNKIIAKIAERNDLKGVIDSVDFNDNTKLGEGKAMIDTLSNPSFIENGMLKTFDYVVANPPFSLKNWTDGLSIDPKSKQVINDHFNRFEDGTPPEKKWRFCFFAPHHQILKKHRQRGSDFTPWGAI